MSTSTIETFPNPRPEREFEIAIDCPEFTSMCPKTGLPDFGVIRIRPGFHAAFVVSIHRGLTSVIIQGDGFRGWKVNKGVESPERYLLQIFWDTLENHTVDFRGGPLFTQWRAIVGPFFAQPPQVEHFTLVGKSAD